MPNIEELAAWADRLHLDGVRDIAVMALPGCGREALRQVLGDKGITLHVAAGPDMQLITNLELFNSAFEDPHYAQSAGWPALSACLEDEKDPVTLLHGLLSAMEPPLRHMLLRLAHNEEGTDDAHIHAAERAALLQLVPLASYRSGKWFIHNQRLAAWLTLRWSRLVRRYDRRRHTDRSDPEPSGPGTAPTGLRCVSRSWRTSLWPSAWL